MNKFICCIYTTYNFIFLSLFSHTGGGFTSSRGTFGKIAKNCDMLCLSFGKAEDVVYSGGSDGNVFVWAGTVLQKTVKAHEGPLFAMHSLDKVGQFKSTS